MSLGAKPDMLNQEDTTHTTPDSYKPNLVKFGGRPRAITFEEFKAEVIKFNSKKKQV